MNCPYCNANMEKGYVDMPSVFVPVEWYPAKREPGIFASRKRNITLASFRKPGSVIMYHCAACRKFLIDQDELQA